VSVGWTTRPKRSQRPPDNARYNCGFGNHDVGGLPLAAVDLDRGWVRFPRPKTGIDRRCPLWPETVKALREWLAKRPKPKNPDDAGLVFIRKRRGTWVKDVSDHPLSKELTKFASRGTPSAALTPEAATNVAQMRCSRSPVRRRPPMNELNIGGIADVVVSRVRPPRLSARWRHRRKSQREACVMSGIAPPGINCIRDRYASVAITHLCG
jgi:hypothetical protein